MEKYEEYRELAVKKMKLADYILTVTYPLVQDPKLLKFVLTNVHLSLRNASLMLLSYERKFKRVPPYNESLIIHYLRPVLERYGLSTSYVNFISEVNEFAAHAKESEVEFIRKGKFVFASKEYDLNIISSQQIKDYLTKAKIFIQQVIKVVNENERITGIL